MIKNEKFLNKDFTEYYSFDYWFHIFQSTKIQQQKTTTATQK